MKFLPECDTVPAERNFSGCQNQWIVAFGPPGEYGEETVKVPVDHGQPWVYNRKVLPF